MQRLVFAALAIFSGLGLVLWAEQKQHRGMPLEGAAE
jgi:hypothetical protein